jgi:hypothetical protein
MDPKFRGGPPHGPAEQYGPKNWVSEDYIKLKKGPFLVEDHLVGDPLPPPPCQPMIQFFIKLVNETVINTRNLNIFIRLDEKLIFFKFRFMSKSELGVEIRNFEIMISCHYYSGVSSGGILRGSYETTWLSPSFSIRKEFCNISSALVHSSNKFFVRLSF